MEMTPAACPECGRPIPTGAVEGSFPSCLLLLGVELPAAESSPTEQAGQRIGPYKWAEQIGEGGLATVLMAEQQEPMRRNVALKIIKLGTGARKVVARFEAGRQALAMMEHHNIAKVLDAGMTLGAPASRRQFRSEVGETPTLPDKHASAPGRRHG